MTKVKVVKSDQLHENRKANWGLSLIYLEIFDVLKSGKNNRKLKNIVVKYARDVARKAYVWPDEIALKERFYSLHTAFGIAVLFVFWATIAINLYRTFHDVVAFGESMMFLMGVSVVFFKVILFVKNCKEIDGIISDFIELHHHFAGSGNPRILEIQREFFIFETGFYLLFHVLAIFLFVSLSVQPIFTEQSIPLPALFPFNLQDPQQHPWGNKVVYGFQVFAIFYGLLAILNIDTMGISCLVQTTVNLRILSLRLRELGTNADGEKETKNLWSELRELVQLHQRIINMVDRINEAYYFTFLLQMFSSTFMLGTAGFEALLSLDDMMVALKFIFFIGAAAMQLFYWCLMGNLAYYGSQDVALAGFEVHDWFAQTPALQRNLMFLIQRAQKPLQFRARPFFPFTMETFLKITRVSYTSFTILYYGYDKAQ